MRLHARAVTAPLSHVGKLRQASDIARDMSISTLTGSPALAVPQVVTASVCGMMLTPKVFPSTSFTVSEVPSSATDPFGAMKRASEFGISNRKRRKSPSGAIAVMGLPVDVTGHDVTAELVAELQRTLEIDRRSGAPGAERGASQGLGRGLDREISGRIPFDDGQAASRTGDRSPDIDLRRLKRLAMVKVVSPRFSIATTLPTSVMIPVNNATFQPSRKHIEVRRYLRP